MPIHLTQHTFLQYLGKRNAEVGPITLKYTYKKTTKTSLTLPIVTWSSIIR